MKTDNLKICHRIVVILCVMILYVVVLCRTMKTDSKTEEWKGQDRTRKKTVQNPVSTKIGDSSTFNIAISAGCLFVCLFVFLFCFFTNGCHDVVDTSITHAYLLLDAVPATKTLIKNKENNKLNLQRKSEKANHEKGFQIFSFPNDVSMAAIKKRSPTIPSVILILHFLY